MATTLPQQSPVSYMSSDSATCSSDLQAGPAMAMLDDPMNSETSLAKQKSAAGQNGAISQLQEFVQCARRTPPMPKSPVLQWTHEQRMTQGRLEFRASVKMSLDGVPHHVVSCWKASKVAAKRDAAERTLCLFMHLWGDVAKQNHMTLVNFIDSTDSSGLGYESKDSNQPSSDMPKEALVLERYCKGAFPSAVQPQWRHDWEPAGWRATVQIELMEVPHTFPGTNQESVVEAYADVARRVLWYLQCPGYEDLFEPDPYSMMKSGADPPTAWAKNGAAATEDSLAMAYDQQTVERKTTVMRVQNKLQQLFARRLEPGMSPWHWSYERAPREGRGVANVRATAHIPLAGARISGTWIRGQREAQIDACLQVEEWLERQRSLSGGAVRGIRA